MVGSPVIVRMTRCRVTAEGMEQLRARVDALQDHPPDGLLHASFGWRSAGDRDSDVMLVAEWRDLASLYAFVGRRGLVSWTPPFAGLESLVAGLDIQHYEGPDATLLDEAAARSDVGRRLGHQPSRAAT